MGEWKRRTILAALAGAGATGTSLALSSDSGKKSLYGGTMALSQAYNVAGDLWIGPDSAKSNVDANSGRVYMASDTQVEYHGDSGSWVEMGVGSSSNPVPEVYSDTVDTEDIGSTSGGIVRQDRPFHAAERSWRHRNLPFESGNWTDYGNNPILTASDLQSPMDGAVADPMGFVIDGEIYVMAEATSSTESTKTVVAQVDVTVDSNGNPTDVAVDTLDSINPIISSASHMSFPYTRRDGDSVYAITQGGTTSNAIELYKTTASAFPAPVSGDYYEHVRVLEQGTGTAGDWNAQLKDPAWTKKDGLYYIFSSAARESNGTHNLLGVWTTPDIESGELTLHPDAPVDFEPYQNGLSPMFHTIDGHDFMYDQIFNLWRFSEVSPNKITMEPSTTAFVQDQAWASGGHHFTTVRHPTEPVYVGIWDAKDSNDEFQTAISTYGVD